MVLVSAKIIRVFRANFKYHLVLLEYTILRYCRWSKYICKLFVCLYVFLFSWRFCVEDEENSQQTSRFDEKFALRSALFNFQSAVQSALNRSSHVYSILILIFNTSKCIVAKSVRVLISWVSFTRSVRQSDNLF